MLALLIAITAALVEPTLLVRQDVAVRDFFAENTPTWAWWVYRTIVWTGQGGILGGASLAVAGLVSYRFSTVRPLVAWVGGYILMGFLAPFKWATDRPAPRCGLDGPEPGRCGESMPYVDPDHATLFQDLFPANSYPSGHALNTIVWCGMIVFCAGPLLKPWLRKAIVLVPPVTATIGMLGLNYHWFWDIPAGMLMGGIILRLVQRVPWTRLPLPPLMEPERKYL